MKNMMDAWERGRQIHKALAWICTHDTQRSKLLDAKLAEAAAQPALVNVPAPVAEPHPTDGLTTASWLWVSAALRLAQDGMPEIFNRLWSVSTEAPLADEGEIKYADVLAISPDGSHICILDWKTNKHVPIGAWPQLYHYLRMAIKQTGVMPKRCSAALVVASIPPGGQDKCFQPFMRREYKPQMLANLKPRDKLPPNSFWRL